MIHWPQKNQLQEKIDDTPPRRFMPPKGPDICLAHVTSFFPESLSKGVDAKRLELTILIWPR